MRGSDRWGSGAFGASRGMRVHVGADFIGEPGQVLVAPIAGIVAKLGYPYASDLSFRYVEISNDQNLIVRVFYVEPTVNVGDYLKQGDAIGTLQKLGMRYPKITEHAHVEVRQNGKIELPPENRTVTQATI